MVTLVKGEFPRCQEFLLSSRTGVWGSPLIGVPEWVDFSQQCQSSRDLWVGRLLP